MARRRPVMDMMRPTSVIRVQAFRKGLLGSNKFWRTVAMGIIAKRLFTRFFGRQPETIELATMKGGGHMMKITTISPGSRRSRRRHAR